MQIPLGAQTWSLRSLLNDNPEAVFRRLAVAGYSFIEPAGFNVLENTMQGFEPLVLKQLANDQGLQIISGHFQFDAEQAHAVCEAAVKMGMKYIVRSFFQNEVVSTPAYYRRAAHLLNQVGETAASYGLQLGYHNHAHEFEPMEGLLPFDILLEHTDPRWVVFQPDLGWMVYAGRDPVVYFERYPGRFPIWHLRDLDAAPRKSTAIGRGDVPFSSFFSGKEMAGLQYAIVEMGSDTAGPLERIEESWEAVRKYNRK